jgi:hypothetical protein
MPSPARGTRDTQGSLPQSAQGGGRDCHTGCPGGVKPRRAGQMPLLESQGCSQKMLDGVLRFPYGDYRRPIPP